VITKWEAGGLLCQLAEKGEPVAPEELASPLHSQDEKLRRLWGLVALGVVRHHGGRFAAVVGEWINHWSNGEFQSIAMICGSRIALEVSFPIGKKRHARLAVFTLHVNDRVEHAYARSPGGIAEHLCKEAQSWAADCLQRDVLKIAAARDVLIFGRVAA
jgi:hypothetical protein